VVSSERLDRQRASRASLCPGLTGREREVAAWISPSKSKREVSEAMTVGVRTVETYITRILSKLGFESRVRIATWAIEKGLGTTNRQP
jgi:DNA-binding CsgD family transcriptional regulator